MLFINARIIDGLGNPPIENGAVLIEGEKVKWVGPADKLPTLLKPEETIDAAGKTLLPGLINAHVHLAQNSPVNPSAQNLNVAEGYEALMAAKNALETLAHGVTTVRDLGARTQAVVHLAEAIRKGWVNGSRVVSYGRCLTMTGGHGQFLGKEADGVEGLRLAARHELKVGAEGIKLMATGGVLTPGTQLNSTQLTVEEMAAAVSEAHHAGKRTAAHAIGTQGIKNALLARVDSIEHGSYLDEECIELMLSKKSFLVPTLTAYYTVLTRGKEGGMQEHSLKKAESAWDNCLKSVAMARSAGIKIVVGTDAGTPFNPHVGVATEIRLLIEAGLTPLEALRAASIDAAELLQVDSVVGSIEVGKYADLLLVQGNPLRDINDLDNVRMVIKGGGIVIGDRT